MTRSLPWTTKRVVLTLGITLSLATLVVAADVPTPQWIWLGNPKDSNETVYLRKTFDIKDRLQKTWFVGSCDNHMKVFINGKQATHSDVWETPVSADVTKLLRVGGNIIAVEARNAGGPAGFVASLITQQARKAKKAPLVTTDRSWRGSREKTPGWKTVKFDDRGWKATTQISPLGGGPWGGTVHAASFGGAAVARPSTATAVASITTLPGFEVTLLHSVPKGSQGSWVSLTVDGKGRLICGDQYGGLYRVTPAPLDAPEEETKVEKLEVNAGGAHGLLWAFDSLYVVRCEGGQTHGLYRLRDTDGDDNLDDVKLLRDFRGGGEHGPHSVILSPDKKSLYICGGNHTDLPAPETSVVPRVWKEDFLLPRQWDANGHARGRMAPGGWIVRTDPEGKSFELVSIGYRNQFDIAFNRDGDLFTYDADMEWDVGTPWYRPTRVNHATSGSEFGWRSGTGKWPEYFPDSLGSVVDVGPGSPTGIAFGYGAKFPRKYENALYICDWSYGKLYAVHMTPDGSTYKGTLEQFVAASPLPLTDVIVRPQDGALYFTIGGRRTQSGLYRVTYSGKIADPPKPVDAKAANLRKLRHRIESLHGKKMDRAALDLAWTNLSNADRAVRFAARVAIEHQPLATWQGRALSETRPLALIEACIALARHGKKAVRDPALGALGKIDWGSLVRMERLALLRAYGLTFSRLGKPAGDIAKRIADRLGTHYPADDVDLNRELCRVLVYLEADGVVERTLALLEKAPTQEEQIHYAYCLRALKTGWTLDERKRYFSWFQGGRAYRGGASFGGFIRNIKNEAVATLSGPDRQALAGVLKNTRTPDLLATLPKAKGPGRKWTRDELLPLLRNEMKGRDFDNGKTMFAAARCFLCHHFDGQGGAGGPDLTGLAGRFSHQDLAASIIAPSKVISDQYQATIFILNNGSVVTGRIVNMGGDNLNVNTDMTSPGSSKGVNRRSILETKPSPISMMPAGLIDGLNKSEVLDLFAYLLSRGSPTAAFFEKDK